MNWPGAQICEFSGAEVDYPRRIVCLTDETTETLYMLGEQERIVGVSGFSTRPPEVRSKARISSFRDADVNAIVALQPDLVLTFSDVQAEITKQLVLQGLNVLNFNQRSVSGILDMIAMLSRIVGKPDEGEAIIRTLRGGLEEIAVAAAAFPRRPTVYFEEWRDPLISGIGWVDELIEIAGGTVIFPELRARGKAQDRVVDPMEVVRRAPEVVFASWCGMKVNFHEMRSRPGWDSIRAFSDGHFFEIPSSIILQPGPAALTDGVRFMHAKVAQVAGVRDAGAMDQAPEGIIPLL
jgi:iron complex transport system substrate-binding protein